VTREVSTLHRRYELQDGLESMSRAELLRATRRALLTIYTPQQTAIWINVHAAGDPVAVARKALRLCGLDLAGEVADGMADRDEPGSTGYGPSDTSGLAGPSAAFGSGAAPERVALEVQRVVTAAVRALLTCQDPKEVHAVLLEVVERLGGHILPAGDATTRAIGIDVSLGVGAPLLAVHDPQRPELAEDLRAHLPRLVDDARWALMRLQRTERLASAAERDSLTGLPDRRAYERLAGRVLPGDVLVVVDLDGFRQVNHTHGHLAGDQVLRIFSAVLQAQMRICEQALRLGSDEFLIVLNQPDADAASCLLERLRAAWKQRRPLPVTFSTGIAPVTTSIDAALQAADQHLSQDEHAPPGSGPTPRDS